MRIPSLLGGLGMAVVIAAFVASASAGTPKQQTLAPVADAYVQSKSPTTNYGDHHHLHVGRGGVEFRSYLKFDLSRVDGIVASATLVVRANSGSSSGYEVHETSADWRELNLAYANAPAPAAAVVGRSGSFKPNSWTKVDVTQAVRDKSGAVAFVLVDAATSTKGNHSAADGSKYGEMVLRSRESDDYPPKLVLDIVPSRPPVAVDDAFSTDEDTPLEIAASTLLANDSDPDGDPLKVVGVSSTSDTHGTVSFSAATQTVRYAPAANFGGPAAFRYTIGDGNGNSATATVAVSVNPVNDAPVAANGVASVDEDGSTTIALQAYDVDSGALTYALASPPSHGSVSGFPGGTVVYSPNANYNGADSFTFTANDGQIDSAPATVSVTVNAVNDAPVAADDSALGDANSPLVLAASSLLANDTDVDGDALSIVGVANATHGSVALGAGNVTFTPDAGYEGDASFSYTVSDGHGGSDEAIVRIALSFQPSFPIRAAFYYPWYTGSAASANSWVQSGLNPYTNYTPSLGFYDSADAGVIAQHLDALRYGKFDAVISSWWGKDHRTDARVPALLGALAGSKLRLALYYELEGSSNPSVDQLKADLAYIGSAYGSAPAYLRVNGRFVVFAYGAGDGCEMVDRWKAANAALGNAAYIVLKVFDGHRTCAAQPDGWHQYAPAKAEDEQKGESFTISPGFYNANDAAPRLYRDPDRFRQNVRDMVASNDPWQLVTTFNEWGEGTAVESAKQWPSDSGYGLYLDALHDDGAAVARDPYLLAGGDVASSRPDDEKTADLLQLYPDAQIAMLGDGAYEYGALNEYQTYYTPSWGRPDILARTHPTTGNHDYKTANGAGYFAYFGLSSADPAKGYYSYDVGSWHVVVLNTNAGSNTPCQAIPCNAGSAQELWLKADLAAHPSQCTLAYWHHPRFSSGAEHGGTTGVTPLWNDLYAAGVDVVLNGHEHNYERFAPQTPAGAADNTYGIREFVVGTGGKDGEAYYLTAPRKPNSEASDDKTLGVLRLVLHPDSYDWAFLPEGGKLPVSPATAVYSDSGSARCH